MNYNYLFNFFTQLPIDIVLILLEKKIALLQRFYSQ